LTAVINVKVPEPEFEGQTKTRLGNPEVRQIVDGIVSDMLQTLFEWNPAIFTAICNKALAAQAASIAAKAARELVSLYMLALMFRMMMVVMMMMMMMIMVSGG
jgi:DNA gyrase subunit B